MYLRHTTRKKNGKVHTYWRLVRSVRVGRRVVQQTVATLGELDAKGRAQARALADHLGTRGSSRQLGLFDEGSESEAVEAVRVDLKRIRLERSREFGSIWLGLSLWRALKLDELCERLIPPGREDVPWPAMATILVLAQLCESSSKLHIAEDWYRTTALDDLLGVSVDKVNDDRLYRALDRLLPFKVELETHLKERLGDLFDIDYDLLLYDVTSSYFEGEAKSNELAHRGYSRDKRPDCKQVCIALVVTRDGIPLGYELFPGNTTDVTTVEDIVTEMERRYGAADRVWVMDRGMVSEQNIEWLQEEGRRYLIGTPKSDLRRFAAQLADTREWRTVREGLEVKICEGPGGDEVFLICRSEQRRVKESAMHERFSKRIEERLKSMDRRLARLRKPDDRGRLERQVGRILGQNSRAAGKFTVRVEEDPSRASRLKVSFSANDQWSEWAALSEGAYVLRTNVKDWSAEDLWRTYVQLSDAEAAFRVQKSDLSIRPIRHQTGDRTRAHVLVCFLAYVLWKTLERWQSRAGLGNSPRTILDELERIQSTDVVIPVVDGREMRLRCIVQPDKAQADLLDRLGLDLPKRLRIPETMHKM